MKYGGKLKHRIISDGVNKSRVGCCGGGCGGGEKAAAARGEGFALLTPIN